VIPRDYITEWRGQAPWVQDFQVEQDLIVCKALVDIFSDELLANALAFRGGTALYKLFLKPPARYSEDIDLVQVEAGPAGDMMDALRAALDPWLGAPRYRQSEGRVTFVYRFASEDTPPIPLRLKVEINTREHYSVYGIDQVPLTVDSRWFAGQCAIPTYRLDELLGTKLRALYQRKKGRDLFDLAVALDDAQARPDRIVECFRAYMDHAGHNVTRAQFEQNLAGKLQDRTFAADIGPLLTDGFTWDIDRMAGAVLDNLIARLPGDPWQGGS
jgi:predicted nucleotidyltransferase component of viral defense system